MGSKKGGNMMFWTLDEYKKFINCVMDKPLSFYGFEILYWCGLRIGELLALTPKDFNFERKTLSITKRSGRKAVKKTSKKMAKDTSRKVAKESSKIATKAGTAVAGSVAGPEGILVGMAAGEAAGMKIDNTFYKAEQRSRMMKFFMDKLKPNEEQNDSLFKLVGSMVRNKMTFMIKKVVILVGTIDYTNFNNCNSSNWNCICRNCNSCTIHHFALFLSTIGKWRHNTVSDNTVCFRI